jgi:ornithine cyclodeaminase/alanine dehydrogenase-like protein (mu-crystallin family)
MYVLHTYATPLITKILRFGNTAIGAPSPDWREMDRELVQRAIVYVDSRESAQKETGDIILNQAVIQAELGELISRARNGELVRSDDAVTVFKSCGLAVEDAAAARYFYEEYAKSPAGASEMS